MYLTADHLKRNGLRPGVELRYFVHAPVIFGVPFFARELLKVAANHGVDVNFQHNLVAIDAKAKTATFEIVGCKFGVRVGTVTAGASAGCHARQRAWVPAEGVRHGAWPPLRSPS